MRAATRTTAVPYTADLGTQMSDTQGASVHPATRDVMLSLSCIPVVAVTLEWNVKPTTICYISAFGYLFPAYLPRDHPDPLSLL